MTNHKKLWWSTIFVLVILALLGNDAFGQSRKPKSDEPDFEEADQQLPVVIITLKNGLPGAYRLSRVQPDKVEVKDQGLRISFTPDQVERIRIPELEDTIREMRDTLQQIDQEEIAEFPHLLQQVERQLASLQRIEQRFGWTIRELPELRSKLEQARSDLSSTIQASNELSTVVSRIHKMAYGSEIVPATWDQIVNRALENTNLIPYLSIRKNIVEDIIRFRRKIRLDLARHSEQYSQRILRMGEELIHEAEQQSLTESRWLLLVKEMNRLVAQIHDEKLQNELKQYVRDVEAQSEGLLREIQQSRFVEQIGQNITDLRQTLENHPAPNELMAIADQINAVHREALVLEDLALKENYLAEIQYLGIFWEELIAASPSAVVAESDHGDSSPSPPDEPDSPATVEDSPNWMDWQTYQTYLNKVPMVGLPVVAGGAFVLLLLVFLMVRKSSKRSSKSASPAATDSASSGQSNTAGDVLSSLGKSEPKE